MLMLKLLTCQKLVGGTNALRHGSRTRPTNAVMARKSSSRLEMAAFIAKNTKPQTPTPKLLPDFDSQRMPQERTRALIVIWCFASSLQAPAARDKQSGRAPLEKQNNGGQYADLA